MCTATCTPLNRSRSPVVSACAAVACARAVLSTLVQDGKYSFSALPLLAKGSTAGEFSVAIIALVSCNVILVAMASCCVLFGEPIAAGSGIPEVKTYLQGCRVPRMLRTSTLFCKAFGVLCSVSGGLVCGKEGPMIHTGAIIAAGLSQGSSQTLKFRTSFLRRFRNDHDKRDFVSAGAAAGVAAAFGAPIGGVLFAVEEAATHWSQQLTWRTFFCSICSTFGLNLLLSAAQSRIPFGELSHPGLFTFGSFHDCQPEQESYHLPELIVFMTIGVSCGFLGAAFNALSVRLTRLRARTLRTKRAKLIEALIIATVITIICFMAPLLLPCVPGMPGHATTGHANQSDAGGSGSLSPSAMFAPNEAPVVEEPPRVVAHHHPALAALGITTLRYGRNSAQCNPPNNALQNLTHRYVCGDRSGLESPLVRLLLSPNDASIKILFHAPAAAGMTSQVCYSDRVSSSPL